MMRTYLFAILLSLSPCVGWTQSSDLSALQAAAQSGAPEALFELGELYRTGQGVLQSYPRAVELYTEAAEKGHAGAQSNLGRLMIQGLGVEADLSAGFALLQEAAESGAGDHLFALGTAYQQGLGTDQDSAQAAVILAKAAETGHIEAAVALGTMLQNGEGVEQDVARAIELYTGPANAGHPRALNNLGLVFARGEHVPQDYDQARNLFEAAAKQGLREAMKNLAALYANGFGVDVNEDYANELLRMAGQGTSDGSTHASALLTDPRIEAPLAEKIEQYQAAAKSGDPVALYLLGMVVAQNAEDARGFRAAAGIFEDLANKGFPVAMANLGILTFQGRGVLQDYIEGYSWLTVAAAAGLEGAIDVRDSFAANMTTEQLNEANELAQDRWNALTGGN